MPRPVPLLQGKIVTLRALEPERDANDYYQMNLEPEMHVWTGNHVFKSVEEARAELERFVQLDDVTMWAVVDKTTGRMIGRFFVCLEERNSELVAGEGNRIAKPYWRKGHNREARRLVLEYVFGRLNADCLETECWSENINSRKSIEAHGFSFVEEISEWNDKHLRQMNKSAYQITRERWEASRRQ